MNNVPLQLGGISIDTKLIGRKALIATLMRHYIGEGLKEAHKVLGGAGPAIAAVPLTVVWVGASAITLIRSIYGGKVNFSFLLNVQIAFKRHCYAIWGGIGFSWFKFCRVIFLLFEFTARLSHFLH